MENALSPLLFPVMEGHSRIHITSVFKDTLVLKDTLNISP